MPRRSAGAYLPLEYRILEAGLRLEDADGSFYGFVLARHLAGGDESASLIAHGTLYKALGRMTELGLLTAEWEESEIAADQNRPRRRLYRVSGEGERVLIAHQADGAVPPRAARTALA